MQIVVPGSERWFLEGDSLDHRAPLVFTVPEVLTASECEDLVGKVEEAGFDPAPITTSVGFVMRPDIRNIRG